MVGKKKLNIILLTSPHLHSKYYEIFGKRVTTAMKKCLFQPLGQLDFEKDRQFKNRV